MMGTMDGCIDDWMRKGVVATAVCLDLLCCCNPASMEMTPWMTLSLSVVVVGILAVGTIGHAEKK
jgi:hypothetical protein